MDQETRWLVRYNEVKSFLFFCEKYIKKGCNVTTISEIFCILAPEMTMICTV
jgi:hypothetical protein